MSATKSTPNDAVKRGAVERLIFALDVGTDLPDTLSWIDRLRGHAGLFKVGKESFTLHGPELVRQIVRLDGRVFLDLKFHDIPHTVARAVEGAVKLDVSMLNIHALGGGKMMEEAVRAVRRSSEEMHKPMPVVLAVTVLTSLDDADLHRLGFRCPADALVLNLSKMAQDAGVGGVVASPRDVPAIRKGCGRDFVIVTPGIRSASDVEGDDQKRTLTAEEAIRDGADYIVVGRPIRMADDPVSAAERVVEEIAAGFRMRGN